MEEKSKAMHHQLNALLNQLWAVQEKMEQVAIQPTEELLKNLNE
jgi:hypothetical protein